MYDLIRDLINHTWQSNYTSDQQYIYYIAGTIIIIAFVIVTDLVYRVFRSILRGKC